MKQFNKTYLPDTIVYNGEVYAFNEIITASMRASKTKLEDVVDAVKSTGKKAVVVNVLNKNLKGIRDLHGNFYQPTAYIFTNKR